MQNGGKMNDSSKTQGSPKSRGVALLLCFLFGWIGLHRFYVNKIVTGLLMMFTMGGFGMWVFVDFVLIIFGMFKDSEDKALTNWGW
jgi:TM2 domain-containing membrane protein YozV